MRDFFVALSRSSIAAQGPLGSRFPAHPSGSSLVLSLDWSRARVSSLLDEIRRMQALDFPYPDARLALTAVRDYFLSVKSDLDSVGPMNDPTMVTQLCRTSLRDLFGYLPLVGFLVRSTHQRNPFEAYGPMSRLAKSLLGQKAKLVLSSEWDFSPYTYHAVPHLADFVFLGLPASEAGNALLLRWPDMNSDTLFGPQRV